MRVYIVRANWDDKAGVWIATSDDVPGLVTEASTFEELDRNVRELVPVLLKANNVLLASGEASVPVRLLAERESRIRLRA